MAFTEQVRNITSDNVDDFLTNDLGMIQDDQDDTVFWTDNSKTVGFKSQQYRLRPYCANGYTEQDNGLSYSDENVYWEKSEKEDVLYVRTYPSSSTSYMYHYLFAKNNNGDWSCFGGEYMWYKNGRVTIGEQQITPNSQNPFSAMLVPDFNSGGFFPNLYKIYTASDFSISGTYVNFAGKPYRVVTVRPSSRSSGSFSPSYAFPVINE